MITPMRENLRQAFGRPRSRWERAADAIRHRAEMPERSTLVPLVAGAAAIGLVAWAAIYFGPDLVRYMKLRRM